jgi:hypothetical protein
LQGYEDNEDKPTRKHEKGNLKEKYLIFSGPSCFVFLLCRKTNQPGDAGSPGRSQDWEFQQSNGS